MSSAGDSEKLRAPLTPADRLEWQSELDSAMSDLDSRLSHPRRRASDVAPQPKLPQLGQLDVTTELLDEIAWRVAEQMRRNQIPTPSALVVAPQPEVAKPAPRAMPEGTAIVIRLRRPLFRFSFPFSFSWKFWRRRRRRRQAMISFSDYRIT